MAEAAENINDLKPQCMLAVLGYLSPYDLASAACVQQAWRNLASDDHLWRTHLSTVLAVDTPTCPRGTPCPSHRDAFYAWARAFGREYMPYLGRAARAWKKIKAWMARHHPAILDTLQPGASEEEVRVVEQALGFTLPPALKAIFRLHNGQALAFDSGIDAQQLSAPAKTLMQQAREASGTLAPPVLPEDSTQDPPTSIFHGLLGGYAFYDKLACTRLLPLGRAAAWTIHHFRRRDPIFRKPARPPPQAQQAPQEQEPAGAQEPAGPAPQRLTIAASFNFRKYFAVDCSDGSIAVSAPRGLIHAAPPGPPGEADGVLRWFEEYASRLETGYYEAAVLDAEYPTSRAVSLFPVKAPGMSVAVTRGVQVRATVVCAPEFEQPDGHLYTYSIRFSLLPEGQQLEAWPATAGPPRALKSCQLLARHWVIRNEQGEVVDEIRGEAVVGKYPRLLPGAPEFVYQSCTTQKGRSGSMEGDFKFVEGTMQAPTGPEWDVECPRFMLEVPEYIF